MKIADLLQDIKYNDARVCCGDKWVVGEDGIWIVYERAKHQKKTRIILVTNSEELAVERLIED